MSENSYTFPVDGSKIPAGVWTKVADGPIELLVTSDDNFLFRWDSVQPAGEDFGHSRRAGEDAVCPVLEGQGLWVFNPLRAFRLCVTEAALPVPAPEV